MKSKTSFALALLLSLSAMPVMFGPVAVPDSGPTISLLSIALIGLVIASRKRLRK